MTSILEPILNCYYYGCFYPDELTKLEVDITYAKEEEKAPIKQRIEALKEQALDKIAEEFSLVNPKPPRKKFQPLHPVAAQTPE